jgi:hypothetical protein
MVTDASTKRALRSYSAARHYNDYYVADSNGNVDGRQGVRLGGLPGVQLLEVFRTPPLPPTQTPTPAKPEPMPAPAAAAKPVKKAAPPPKAKPKPAKRQPKAHTWKIPDATYSRATKEWRISDSEQLSEVFERVLAFGAAVKALAATFNLPFDSNAPESLAGALAERLESLSAQIDYEKSKERQLRIANNQLTEERDALSSSVQSLQSRLKDRRENEGDQRGDPVDVAMLPHDERIPLQVGHVVERREWLELKHQPADVGVKEPLGDAVRVFVVIDMLVVGAVLGGPKEHRVFKGTSSKDNGKEAHEPVSSESQMRE